jgi:hypothetical protein
LSLHHSAAHFTPDTGVEREVYDVGILENWPTTTSETGTTTAFRLVVTARTLQEGEEVRIGKRKAGRVWELFITTLPQQGFTGVDILNLYLGRGLLENCLRHEDREQQIDRWVNIQANGQSFWQLIALWISNQRLWLGNRAESGTERTTLWSAPIAPVQAYSQAAQVIELQAPTVAVPVEPVCVEASPTITLPYTQEAATIKAAAATPCAERPKVPPTPTAQSPKSAKPKHIRLQPRKREPFTHKDFRVTDEGQVSCPAGQPMSRRNRIRLGHGHERWIFAARYEECLRCPLAVECMGEALPKASCRQVAYRRCPSTGRLLQEDDPRLEPLPVAPPSPPVLLIASPPKVASGGASALLWKDFPSSHLRQEWSKRLRTQRIEVEVEILPAKPKSATVLLDRHRRAHRRLSWAQCLKRNQSLGTQTHWSVQLHGVPSGIIAYLKSLEERVSASAA